MLILKQRKQPASECQYPFHYFHVFYHYRSGSQHFYRSFPVSDGCQGRCPLHFRRKISILIDQLSRTMDSYLRTGYEAFRFPVLRRD